MILQPVRCLLPCQFRGKPQRPLAKGFHVQKLSNCFVWDEFFFFASARAFLFWDGNLKNPTQTIPSPISATTPRLKTSLPAQVLGHLPTADSLAHQTGWQKHGNTVNRVQRTNCTQTFGTRNGNSIFFLCKFWLFSDNLHFSSMCVKYCP